MPHAEAWVSTGPDSGQQETQGIPRQEEHNAPCPTSGRGSNAGQEVMCMSSNKADQWRQDMSHYN